MLQSPADSSPTVPIKHELARLLPGLHARALKLCSNTTEAQDLVQDTIERALRFEGTYQPGTNLRAWAQQILFSVFVSRCRRLKRERRAIDSLTCDPCAWTSRETAPVMRVLSPRVASIVESLPPHFARVVRLVDLDDCSYKDAARTLGVPVGTIMSRLFRGRRLLAVALADSEAIPACAA